MRIALDTNIAIRFLTHDDEHQYRQAYAVFQHPQLYFPTRYIPAAKKDQIRMKLLRVIDGIIRAAFGRND